MYRLLLENPGTKAVIYKIVTANCASAKTGAAHILKTGIHRCADLTGLATEICQDLSFRSYDHTASAMFGFSHGIGGSCNKRVTAECDQLCLRTDNIAVFAPLISGNDDYIRLLSRKIFDLLIKIHVIASHKAKSYAIQIANTSAITVLNA